MSNVYAAAVKPIRFRDHGGNYVTGQLLYYRPASDDWTGSYSPQRAHTIKALSEFVERDHQIVLPIFIDDLYHFTTEVAAEIEASLTSGGAVDPRLNKVFFVYCDEDETALREFNQRRRERFVNDVVNSGAGDQKTDFPTQPIAPPTSLEPTNESREKSREERKAEKRNR